MKKATAQVAELPRNRIPQTFHEAAVAFEVDKTERAKASEKRAWHIVYAASAIAVIAVLGASISFVLRKEPIPLVMMVDKITGEVTVLRGLLGEPAEYPESVNKARLAEYVLDRASYDWATISTELASVKLRSGNDVAKQYETEVRAPEAPLSQFKDKARVKAAIVSVTFIGKIAQIRYTTEKTTPAGDNNDGSPVQRWIATVTYGYDPEAKMTDQERLMNPTAFKVWSWRADQEVTK